MYEQAIGGSFSELPLAVQQFHRLAGRVTLPGRVETRAPATWLARVLAYCLGTPRSASAGPIEVEVVAQPLTELWTRRFPSQTMVSRLSLVNGRVEERLGAARLKFDLVATTASLTMELRSLRFLGVPCPKWLMPRVIAEETGDSNKFHFRVEASLPLVGVVASYQGHLRLPTPQRHA